MLRMINVKTAMVALFVFGAQSAALAASDMDIGKRFYAEGKFDKAARCFQAVLTDDPDDADAHYLLANSLLALKQAPAAITEYRTASQLDVTGEAGRYSRQALTSLTGGQAALVAPNSRIEPADRTAPSRNDGTDLRHSVQTISKTTDERATQLNAECDLKVKRLLEEGDGRVKRLEAEMRERIENNGHEAWSGSPLCRRAVKYYDPEPENKIIREEYAPKIDAIKAEYKRRADETIAMYKSKAAAYEDSAITLDKTYLQSSRGVKLNPLGTGMNVRMYETSGEPTGAPVPVQAAPAKSLPSSTIKK